MNQKRQ